MVEERNAKATSWEKSFKTFKVAMLLLEAAESERLEEYLEFVKDLNHQLSLVKQHGAHCTGRRYGCGVSSLTGFAATCTNSRGTASRRRLVSSVCPSHQRG